VRGPIAAALAVVALAGCGGSDRETTTVTVTQPVIVTFTDTAPPAETACSASGLRIALPDQELPAPVAETRRRIFEAAIACDYDALQAIALEDEPGFTYSYGGETSAADYWRGEEERGGRPLAILVQVLAMPHTRNEAGFYAWPTAYSEHPTEEAWNELEAVYSRDEINAWREFGSYLGYRVGITPAGEWQFFVAGD
jgi:hypothetical protein